MKVLFIVLVTVFLTACFNTRTHEALAVKPISDESGCESLGAINGRSPPFALSPADERIGAMNSAYNKVASLGGNAILILNAERTTFGGAVVQAGAYRCPDLASKRRTSHPAGW